jgi:peptide/nickel transport system ATP-binding protein
MTQPLLQVENLEVAFSTRHGVVQALHGIDIALQGSETLGIVGESGSGKSVTSLAVMRLLDRAGRIVGGRIRFEGRDITHAGHADLRRLRGSALSMIFQNPRAALNPIRTVEHQIVDVLAAHGRLSQASARVQALELLRAVRIRDPETRLAAYPHELSGGMCQRVMIAMAIACEPALLIADEPTTGLDVTTQQTVMELLARIKAERGMAMILITHDLGLAARWCDRIAVMEAGRVVEHGATERLFEAPAHAYTKRLVAASPTRHSTLADLAPDAPKVVPRPIERKPGTPPLLELQRVVKSFGGPTPAVDDVSFRLAQGGALGLVGESGSGKSTLSRLVCRLIDPDDGDIVFDGESIARIPAREFHKSPQRRDIQIVFQDPHDSLNPRYTAFDSIAHPLRRLEGLRDGAALTTRVRDAARRAGLPLDLLERFPHQLSGGQKARVGIARAVASRPRLLVLDEPTAALDVSVQAVILQLLDRLRREEGIGLLFVSHDLNVVRMLCDDLVVLQAGKVMEAGPSQEIFQRPKADYTRTLLDAVPYFEPQRLIHLPRHTGEAGRGKAPVVLSDPFRS